MSETEMVLEVSRREHAGKGVARRLRADGRVPAVLYGAGKDTVPIEVDKKSVLELLRKSGSEHPVFLLRLAGASAERHAMIRDMQIDPISRRILHIDFLRLVMSEKIAVEVPVELEGTPDGVKNEGGVLDFVTRAVEVECLPAKIPSQLTVDVSALHIGQHVEVKDLVVPEEVTVLEDEDRVIASVAPPRMIEVEEEEDEGLLIETELEEPEVIGRGKSEDEEEEEDEG